MNGILLTIASSLSVTPNDVMIGGVILLLWIILIGIGIRFAYEMYFGVIVGLGIYVMLTMLLSPKYQPPGAIAFFSNSTADFLISSSAYLIFILMILTPLSGNAKFPVTKNRVFRLIERILAPGLLFATIIAIFHGFTLKTYIFQTQTALAALHTKTWYIELFTSKIGIFFERNLQGIVVISVLFFLYKMMFSEIGGAIFFAIWGWILSLRYKDRGGSYEEGGGGGHEGHDNHGHDGHDDHGGGHDDHGHDDDHGGHDDHGHDDHGHDGHDDHGGGHDDHGHGHH